MDVTVGSLLDPQPWMEVSCELVSVLALRPSDSFLGIVSLVFLNTVHGVRVSYEDSREKARFFFFWGGGGGMP